MRSDENRLSRALGAWRMFTWHYEVATDRLVLSAEADAILELGGRRVATLADALALLHPADREVLRGAFDEALRLGVFPAVAVRVISPETGTTYWLEGRNEVERDASGAIVGAWGLVKDVTERRRAAEHLHAIAAHTTDFLLRIDADGTLRYINRVLPPWTLETALGRSWLELVPPEERARAEEMMARVLDTGQPVVFEAAGHAADGARAWYSKSFAPIIERGAVTGALVIARDITELRDAEERLRVSERLASVGLMAAGIAHEINNPLAALAGNITLAGRVVAALGDTGGAGRLRDMLADAEQAAIRIRDVVRDLSLFSRADERQLVPVDLHGVIESTLRLAWHEIRHRATLVTALGDVPLVRAEPSRLGQIVLNLLVNAAHALPLDDAARHEIRIATRRTERSAIIEVSDTGPGIAPDVLDHLFTPFRTTKAIGEGRGLGLSICHRIVTSFGGTIRAASPPGRGAVLTVELPAADPSSAASPPAPDVVPTAQRRKVLVIDDEPMVARAIATLLALDHDVEVANSGRDALDRLASGHRWDAILCDLLMPETTGMDVHAAITAMEPALADRMIFLTGGPFTRAASEFLERVPNRRLVKPFDVRDLLASVDAVGKR